MNPPEKSLLPSWRAFARRRPVYAPLDDVSGSDAIEIPQVSRSVFLALESIFENSIDVGTNFTLSQTFSSPTCIDCSNADLNKALPKPPSRIHFIRHNLVSRHYHRLRKLQGYHFGVLWCAGAAALVLIINLILTIWAVTESGVQDGLGTLYDGSCKRTASLTFWIHLGINVLSTLLLGASNYSMQCLSSPTRGEIDKAHSLGIWLDIRVPSVRNLRRLSTTRIILWWLLAVSSIPLHLLYNSAVFSSLCAQRFDAYIVTSDFLTGKAFNVSEASDLSFTLFSSDDLNTTLEDCQNNQASLVKLENKECVDVYSAPIISTYSDLLFVTSNISVNNSLLAMAGNVDSPIIINTTQNAAGLQGSNVFCMFLLCGRPGTVPDPQNMTFDDFGPYPAAYVVEYCLSKPVEEHCKLQFSLTIMIAVIICNMIKTVCMTIILWKQDPEPLATLGDAIASFLDQPDITTRRNCIAGRDQFKDTRYWGLLVSRWDLKGCRWFRAASLRRWITCNVL